MVITNCLYLNGLSEGNKSASVDVQKVMVYCLYDFMYVALSDTGSMKFSHILEQSPRNWDTTMRQNVVLTIFHTQNLHHHGWKTVRTTLQCTVGLQLQGEGHKMDKNCGTNLSHGYPCFSNLLPGIGGQRNIKVSF